MDGAHVLQNNCKLLLWTWKASNHRNDRIILLSKTLITSPTYLPKTLIHSSSLSNLHNPSTPPHAIPQDYSTKHTTLLVESFHEHQILKSLLRKLNNNGSCPLQILEEDGDWPKNHFWAVIKFLKVSSRSNEILQVFDMWKSIEKSRINEFNYEKIIELLSEEGLMEDATSAFMEMKSFVLIPSLPIYNSIIHGYSMNGMFDDALFYLNKMKDANLSPVSDTYDGLIQGYAKYKMYDEMGMCLKRMKLDGCLPDRDTYNLLIQEFARGGLLSRMERVYQSMRGERINAKSSTLIAMLEAYLNFGIVEKMEKILKRVWHSQPIMKEDLIRRLALFYIENYMFSRLNDLANNLAFRTGRTEFVWCLLLLSNACILSQKGMDSVIKEMAKTNVSWNVTTANIVLLAYLKMKDFMHLRTLLSKLPDHLVQPDIVTVGVLFDANAIGFDGSWILETWRRMGLLNKCAETNTDPLVLAAFGKGQFIKDCEEAYSSLEAKVQEKKKWTYSNLIDLVAKHNGRLSLWKGI